MINSDKLTASQMPRVQDPFSISPPRRFANGDSETHSPRYEDDEELIPRQLSLQDMLTRWEGSSMSGQEGLSYERSLFLKAALQLLEERDNIVESRRFCAGSDGQETAVIKCGYLKKANGRSVAPTWKMKFVEVRHGYLTYEDEAGWGDHKKRIQLSADNVVCRPIRLDKNPIKGVHGNTVFEVSVRDGPKRLFMATSREERQAWTKAIHTAMIGSSGDFAQQLLSSSKKHPHRHMPYADEIARFQAIQSRVEAAETKEDFMAAVQLLTEPGLSVPVNWVKDRLDDALLAQKQRKHDDDDDDDDIEHRARGTLAQTWKDLHRDTIVVNGYEVTPEMGPEAMLGALVRYAMIEVEKLKQTYENFELNEAHLLSCARDILTMSNRTQSGGDTYYCIDALLRKQGLVILCPLSNKGDPLQVTISQASRTPKSHQSHHEHSRSLSQIVQEQLERPGSDGAFNHASSSHRDGYPDLDSPSSIDDDDRPEGDKEDMLQQAEPVPVPVHGVTEVPLLTLPPRPTPAEPTPKPSAVNRLFSRRVSTGDGGTPKTAESPVGSESLAFSPKSPPPGGFRPWTSRPRSAGRVDGSNSHSLDHSPLPLFRSVTHSRGGETTRSGGAFEFEFRRPKANSMSGASFTRAVFGSGSTPSASERVDHLDDISSENEETIPAGCVQVKVEAISQYKICNTDPQDEDDDIWGIVVCRFEQTFYIKSHCNGRPSMTDRLVTVWLQEQN